MLHKPVTAFAYAIAIWVVGFIWGSIVFVTPALRSTPPIRYVSSNPTISFPIILIWTVLAWWLARRYLAGATNRASTGFKLGVVFVGVNFLFDLIVLVFMLRAGFKYFVSASVWFAYATLLLVPWMAGRAK